MRPSTPYTLLILLSVQMAACTPPPAEEVTVPPLFSDQMVLQRDHQNPVWGWGTPGGKVSVRIDGQQHDTRIDADSTWTLNLDPMPAGGPHTLQIAGADTLVVEDVLIGDVWLASGQSNMQWSVQISGDAEAEIAAADHPNIRLFTVKRITASSPQTTIPSDGWTATSPETIPGFSAVAYYFGRALQAKLDVPIGLIHSSWGGTVSEAWTSANTLSEHPDFTERIAEIQAAAVQGPNKSFQERLTDWLAAIDDTDQGYEGSSPIWAAYDAEDEDWASMNLPGRWEGQGLPNVDGVVWFRKTITLPASWDGQAATLFGGRVDDLDITWVNGQEVGRTRQYNTVREYEIPAGVLRTGKNVIVIRAFDTGGGGGIWGEPEEMRLVAGNRVHSLASSWRYRIGADPSTLPPVPSADQNTPTYLFNAMIHPLVPYRLKGAIWYQGESNAGRAYQYRTLFPALITDWREQWSYELPFMFVQLANFMEQQSNPVESDETWPELREAQSMALDLPLTGMAVTIDIGEADDIHPLNKQDVGRRLALAAFHHVYEHDGTYSGPIVTGFEIEGNQAIIQFDQTDTGLMAADGGILKGFAIAGDDRQFEWAEASIDGNTVVLHHPAISTPVAVRYSWANNPIGNLVNGAGLPASPFRTDDWPGITDNNR